MCSFTCSLWENKELELERWPLCQTDAPTNGRDGSLSVGRSVVDDLGNGLSDRNAEDLITKDIWCLTFIDEKIFYTRVEKMDCVIERYDRPSFVMKSIWCFIFSNVFHVSDPLLRQSHPYKGSLARALISSLMLAKTNCWTTISVAGLLRGHDANYMCIHRWSGVPFSDRNQLYYLITLYWVQI